MPKSMLAGPTPHIHIKLVKGDLSLVGWDGEELLLKADEQDLSVNQEDARFTISCEGDLAVRLPSAAQVHIVAVDGDASMKNISGSLQVGEVQGDLSIREVNTLQIERVHSDLALRSTRGDVHIRDVSGDALIRDSGGSLRLDAVADDLVVRGITGDLHARAGSDVVLYFEPRPGQVCDVAAGDDLLLVLPPGANAALELKGDEIQVHWPGVENDDSTSRQVQLGDGSAQIRLTGGGEVRVTDQADAGARADEFGNFAGIHFDWSIIGDEVSKRVERVARRAEQKVAGVARRVERTVTRHARDLGALRGVADAGWSPSTPPAASEAERAAILRMLEQKKITADEANQLLAALEGQG